MWKLRQVISQEEQRQNERVEDVLSRFTEHESTEPVENMRATGQVIVIESEVASSDYDRLGCLGKHVVTLLLSNIPEVLMRL